MENIPSEKDRSMFSCERYQFFLDAPFEISNHCCSAMKKAPMKEYQKTTGRVPITAQMASESRLRTQIWLKQGCNAFDAKKPISNPMSFWTKQDVLLYIYTHKDEMIQWRKDEYRKVLASKGLIAFDDIDEKTGLTVEQLIEKNITYPICSVYGEVVKDHEVDGQIDMEDLGIFELERPLPKTTGCERTGCVLCSFGCHMEKGESRFQRLFRTHPKYRKAFDVIQNSGVTYREAIDWINENNGKGTIIRY